MYYKVETTHTQNKTEYFISEFADKKSTTPLRRIQITNRLFFKLTRICEKSRIPCEFVAAKLNLKLITFDEIIEMSK